MSQERLGRCNQCGTAEGFQHDPRCIYNVEPEKEDLCEECGKQFKGLSCEVCTDHLQDGQELIDYVVGKNECLEKAIAENRALQTLLDRSHARETKWCEKLEGAMSSITQLNNEKVELVETVKDQTDHINRLLAKEFGILGQK